MEIQIDGGARQRVAYGTTREDTVTSAATPTTASAITFNWNRLGNGDHNLRAFADGVEFANVNFTVTTLGVEYLRGASGGYILSNFPQAGSEAILNWAESHQNFVIVGASRNRTNLQPAAAVVPLAQFPATLESPQQGSFESGIGLIRGWVCQASTVEIQIDGGARQRVAYGTTREDTVAVCGDADNGFGYTFNWNRLGNGSHNLRVFADGVEFANVSFTVTTLGVEFLRGASGQYMSAQLPASRQQCRRALGRTPSELRDCLVYRIAACAAMSYGSQAHDNPGISRYTRYSLMTFGCMGFHNPRQRGDGDDE